MRSVMTNQFSQVPKVQIPRSTFNRSHGHKTTFDAGFLIPIFVDHAVPGDTFNLNMTAFSRMSTPIYPIMDNLYMESFFFAVPYRLVWDNWQKFCGEQTDPGDSIDYTIPTTNWTGVPAEGSLYDYFGIPSVASALVGASMLPFRAYNLIYNEWFRDENLQNSVDVLTDDGPDTLTSYQVRRRGKRHDYFTSCLPWPQKAPDGAVSLPLGTSAPVVAGGTGVPTWQESTTDASYGALNQTGTTTVVWQTDAANGLAEWNDPALEADLSNATAATINQVRQALQIQQLQERDARGGTRYTEIVKSHFGVTSPDARLQRPEFLGGGSSPIQINPVQQTSETNTSPQGTLAAYATATLNNHGFTKSFTEHCVVIGLVNVRADLTYQQGIERHWNKSTRYDFYWPSLARIGEQAVLNREIYYNNDANDDLTFGYQERYAEMRYKPSLITGAFRSAAATPLDAWHLSQDFSALPTLGDTFIQDTPPVSRVVATPSEPEFIFDSYFDYRCARPMPLNGIPGGLDRF